MKKTTFYDKTLTRELSFSIGAVLIVLLVALGLFLALRVNKGFRSISDDYLNQVSEYYSSSTEKILEGEFKIGTTLKAAMECFEEIEPENRRDYLNNFLRQTLEENPNLVDTWCVWEPNALDGMDARYATHDGQTAPDTDQSGRFIPYWTQVGSTIDCTALTEYEEGSWYVDPFNNDKGILIDPNLYEVGGKMMWVCGAAFPIKDKNGKSIGVVGLDMSLDTLTNMLRSAELYKSGYLSLISNTGLTAVDKDINLEGQTYTYYDDKTYGDFFKKARSSLQSQTFSTADGYIHIVNPIQVDGADEIWYLGANVPSSEVNRPIKDIVTIVIIGFVITTVVLYALTFLFVSIMSSSLKRGVVALKNIAQGDGDLTVRVEAKKDNELGQMYTYFNETMEKLQNSIGKVKTESESMEQTGIMLTENMNTTAAAANQVTANIESVNQEVKRQADNVKSANNSVEEINDQVRKLVGSIESQSSSVVESSSAIEQMVANIRSVTNILKANSETIENLGKSSEAGRENIASSVDATEKIREQSKTLLEASSVIQNIAEQTNLLAMNAAIEAAHAGEAGKGFSVVADEIRKLAEDSNTQGKKITENLNEVLSSIEDVTNSTMQMQTQFGEIYELTQKVSQQELTIMHAMQEQSEGGGQVLQAMKEINDITMNVRNGSEAMQAATDNVNKEMDVLTRITDEITSSMEEMAFGLADINNSINQVNDETHNLKDSIQSLTAVVNTFKV